MTGHGHIPWEPADVEPIDPESEEGKRIARDLGELVAVVEDRLAREAAESEVGRRHDHA